MSNLYCIACPNGCLLTISYDEEENLVVEGNTCDKGIEFAAAEVTDPVRLLTATVRTAFSDVPVISVRTDGEIPKDLIEQAMDEINDVVVTQELEIGSVVIENVAEAGVPVIITSAALMKRGEEQENKNAEISKTSGARDDDLSESDGSSYNTGANGTGGSIGAAGVLDNLGPESADGFVGAAGEAVGVDGGNDDGNDSKEFIRQRSRPHIKR